MPNSIDRSRKTPVPILELFVTCLSFALSGLLLSPAMVGAVVLGPGDLVAVDTVSDNVVHIDPDTGAQTLISSAGGGEDVVIDDTGRIFLVRRNDVVEVDPETGLQTFVVENLTASSETIFGMELTPGGDLVVATFSSVTPFLVDVDTGVATPIPGIAGSRHGVAIDAGGDLYFAQEVSDEVRRYTSAGSFVQSYALLGVPPNAFGRPGSLALAPNGDLVVSDENEGIFVRVDIGTGGLDPLDPGAFAAMSAHFDVDANGDYIVPAIESGLPIGIYRVDAGTGAVAQIATGGFLSTGNGLRSVAVAPDTLSEPPGEVPPFEPCPGEGSSLTDPIVMCAKAAGTNGPIFDSEVGYASNLGIVNETESSAGAEAAGSTDVDTQLGYAEFDVSAEKLGTTATSEADVSVGVHWDDTVTIDALGFTGETGRFRGVFLLTVAPNTSISLGASDAILAEVAYAVDVETDGNAGWQYVGQFGDEDSVANGLVDLDGGVAPGVIVTGFNDFVFGTPFDLDVDARLRLTASSDGADATATVDALAKVVWLGIIDIQSVGPLITPVPDVWVSSSSTEGFDWRTAVGLPEPGLGAMLVAGAMGLSALSRRRLR